ELGGSGTRRAFRRGRRRRDLVGSLLALLLLSAVPGRAHAQVFIASRPEPDFTIGPLFVSASVGPQNLVQSPTVLRPPACWRRTLAPHRRADDLAQDLYLLWPGEVVGTAGAPGADPPLARQVEALGFRVREHGRLRLAARSRTEMGTSAGLRPLGEAPFVAFARESGPAAGARGATYIRIPWVPELASLDWLVPVGPPV